MVQFYEKRVIQGKKLWNEIPSLWQDAVCEALEADGYILNEDGTVTKTE